MVQSFVYDSDSALRTIRNLVFNEPSPTIRESFFNSFSLKKLVGKTSYAADVFYISPFQEKFTIIDTPCTFDMHSPFQLGLQNLMGSQNQTISLSGVQAYAVDMALNIRGLASKLLEPTQDPSSFCFSFAECVVNYWRKAVLVDVPSASDRTGSVSIYFPNSSDGGHSFRLITRNSDKRIFSIELDSALRDLKAS